MNFDEKITALAQKAESLIEDLETEEATKNALVMPFIEALGYDIDNKKVETKNAIEQLSDIYKFAPGILASVSNYHELN